LISSKIQDNIQSIQSPPEEKCENINKYYCRVPEWGFAAQIHSLMTCLLVGYYTKTLVVIDQVFSNYLNGSNSTWDQFISPISETCQQNHTIKYAIKNKKSIIESNTQ